MIYPPFTLRKDGAVMLCEDASEFDTNYDAPAANVEVAKVEIVRMADTDPLEKFADRMSVLYDDVVDPMLNMDFSFETPQQAIDACEKLAFDTSTIFNVMRIKLAKLAGIACGGITENLAKEAFNSHAGTFMKNAAMIKRQGIESYKVTWKEVPVFGVPWQVGMLVDVVSSKPDVLREMIYEPELNALSGSNADGLSRNFNGFVDMMQCIFKDHARLERLSASVDRTLSFQDLMTDCQVANDFIQKDNQSMLVKYFGLLSSTLREVARATYDIQVNLVDNTIAPEDYEKQIRPLVIKVTNVFGVGIAVGCYFATCLRRAIAIQKGCEEYTKLLLDTIKEHGGKL